MADIEVRLLNVDPAVTILMHDNGDGTYSFPTTSDGGGGGGEVSLDAATLAALETITIGALPAEATEIIAWAPRSPTTGNAYVPGFYNVCDSANTEEVVAIPTTPNKPMSLMIWFETSTSDETLKSGRIGFANNGSDDPGTVNNTDTVLGYHPAIPMEYVIPSWATHVWVAAPTAGRVARGLWTYE